MMLFIACVLLFGVEEVICQACPPNCAACTCRNKCSTCTDGFYNGYLYDDHRHHEKQDCSLQCESTYCESCTSYNNCTKCKAGYCSTESNRNCQHRCKRNCKICTSCDLCTSCNPGYYSASCDVRCARGCTHGVCNIDNGRCKCRLNFEGAKCETCSVGRYGENCDRSCSRDCINNVCDRKDGRCSHVSHVSHVCHAGFYLQANQCESCPNNCLNCSSMTTCSECNPRFWGPICNSHCLPHCAACSGGHTCSLCDKGFHGRSCSQPCPENCVDNTCGKTSGECFNSKPAFAGSKCNACKDGQWGKLCQSQCSAGCMDTKCNLGNGSCSTGCKHGFSGSKCDTCFNDRYGDKCKQCPLNCESCTSESHCSVCKSRFWGNTCQLNCSANCVACTSYTSCSVCDEGNYGSTCQNKCPDSCDATSCNKEDGACANCKVGLYGSRCDHLCSENCVANCGEDGKCYSCVSGFYGFTCKSECPRHCRDKCFIDNGYCHPCMDGYYGAACENACPINCSTCILESNCTLCKPGKTGKVCDIECSNCRHGTACGQLNGQCADACADGFYGQGCDLNCSPNCKTCARNSPVRCKSCAHGKYDTRNPYSNDYLKCSFNCSRYCLHGTCDAEDGHCTEGCVKGYWGKRCKESCGTNCLNGQCFNNNGTCKDGCITGWYGRYCSWPCTGYDDNCIECSTSTAYRYGGCLTCKNRFYPSFVDDKSFRSKQCIPCPVACANEDCYVTNGSCRSGCIDGRWGVKCQNTCNDGCLACTPDTGECTVCVDGRYSHGCMEQCSSNCSMTHGARVCAISGGECVNGCVKPTRHGAHCDQECNVNCLDQRCNVATGACSRGCTKPTRHGKHCDQECNVNCLDQRCNVATGACSRGCTKPTRHGKHCDQECNVNCLDQRCNVATGACSIGCTNGHRGELCIKEIVPADSVGRVGYGVVAGLVVLVLVIGILVFVALNMRRNRTTRNQIVKCEGEDVDEMGNNMEGGAVSNNEDMIADSDAVIIYAIPTKTKKANARVLLGEGNGQQKAESQNREDNLAAESMVVDNANMVTTSSRLGVTLEGEGADEMGVDEEEAREMGVEQGDAREEMGVDDDDQGIGDTSYIVNTQTVVPDDTYYNTAEVLRRRVPLDRLKQFVSKKTKEDYATEFKQFPVGLIKPYIQSQKKANRSKNRYRGVYPYDAGRVVLQEGESDYINASYIDGYKKRKAYIASMGPTVEHMGDFSVFWVMVWQQRVGIIVMLTNLKELGVRKCDKYWPNIESREQYGDVTVTCQSEVVYTDYTKRMFITEKSSERRKVCHMHFTSWPDKRTPDKVSSLAEFRKNVKSLSADSHGPVLAHCSAGVGRTGTYLALDMLINEGVSEGYVDILACVRNLREQRVNMVQTVGQYEYLHEALVYLLADDKGISSDNKNASESKYRPRMHRH